MKLQNYTGRKLCKSLSSLSLSKPKLVSTFQREPLERLITQTVAMYGRINNVHQELIYSKLPQELDTNNTKICFLLLH